MDDGQLLQDAVRGAHAAAWEYLRADDQPSYSPWRFHATAELKALFGYADDELDDQPEAWLALLHPNDVQLFLAALERCFLGLDERLDLVFRARHRKGHWCTVRASGSLEREANGHARRLCGLTWDVTHYVVERARNELIARSFDSAISGLAVCDAEFRIVEANRAMHQISGWPDGELIGRALSEVIFGSAAAAEQWTTARRKGNWLAQVDAVRRDGTHYPAELHLAALRGDDGTATHYTAAIIDLHAVFAGRSDASTEASERPHPETSSTPHPMLELAIKEAVGMRSGLVVFVLGVDSLSSMIETYGRLRVEHILDACISKLAVALDDIVVVSRTDRERFVVVVADLMEERAIEQAFARLLHAVSSVVSDQKTFHVSVSAGAAVFPLDGTSAEVLLQRAESALDESRRRGRNAGSLELYRPQLSDYASDRVHLESSLRKALKVGAFECHLQPKVRLEDGRWVGAEALMRWRIGDTWIAPSRFIPIAEESGLIKDIGRWILWEAATHIAQWRRDGLIDENFRVAVNLAGAQLDDELLRTVRAVLSYNRLSSDALMLELTETIIVKDPERARRLLNELRRIGVRISLDDFGTGYTSMSQLQTLPIDELKIDRSFVRGLPADETSCAIVRSVVTLAKGLRLDAIAEGIETEAQRAALLKLGYRYGQGFLFAKAMAPPDFERALRATQPSRAEDDGSSSADAQRS